MKNKVTIIVFLVAFFTNAIAQENPKKVPLNIQIPSSVVINGTSTLHDWKSVVENTQAQLLINNFSDVSIETLNVKVEVKSIKSGKKIMDKLTYKALKSDKHPTITFNFIKGEITKENSSFIDILLNGDLTIAGITKNVSVATKINKHGELIVLKGNHKLKMTDFGVDPPKALLGTIKTGDEITIEFNLTFK